MRRPGIILAGSVVGILAVVGVALSLPKPGGLTSGVEKGGMLSAYHPTHVTGADKNTDTCPVCNYPSNPAVQAWINTDDPRNVTSLVKALEKTVTAHADQKMKAFVVFINPKAESKEAMEKQLKDLAEKTKVQNVALVYLPNSKDDAVKEYQINTDTKVKNTIFVYKNRKVDTKFVNFVADTKGLDNLDQAVKSVL